MVFTLGGATLSIFTLGGALSWITLRVCAGVGLGCMMRNISAKRHSAAVCSVPFVLYGGAGAGFFMSWIIYCAACAVASADGVCGIGNLYGGGFTVSLIHVALVLLI